MGRSGGGGGGGGGGHSFGGGGGGGFSSGGGFSGGFSGGSSSFNSSRSSRHSSSSSSSSRGYSSSSRGGGPSFGGMFTSPSFSSGRGGGPSFGGGMNFGNDSGGSIFTPTTVGYSGDTRVTGDPASDGCFGGGCSRGCLWAILIFFIITLVFALVLVLSGGMDEYQTVRGETATVPTSTVQREALPKGAVNETEYYRDLDGDWISSESTLLSGMKTFYEATGVQPFLLILPNNASTDVAELSQFSDETYEKLFTDDAHFLLVFCYQEGSDMYWCGYTVGQQARSVLDDEAIQIFQSYMARNWADWVDEDTFFSKTYAETAERIMTVTPSPIQQAAPIIVVLAIVVIAVIAYLAYKRRKDAEKDEMEHTEKVLSMPLKTFKEQEVEDLTEKYEKFADKEVESLAGKYNGNDGSASVSTAAKKPVEKVVEVEPIEEVVEVEPIAEAVEDEADAVASTTVKVIESVDEAGGVKAEDAEALAAKYEGIE